jgi:hypothetical protein
MGLCCLVFLLCSNAPIYGQHDNTELLNPRKNLENLCDHARECASPAEKLEMKARSAAARASVMKTVAFRQLVEAEKERNPAQTHVYFDWPLEMVPAYNHIHHEYTIEFYVDHDNTSVKEDYLCNERTYNGHDGTDINIWPFFWHMMAQEYVHVVAAAPGIVTHVEDNNNNDQNCAGCNMTANNYISILHSDGSTSFYLHIKDGSALVDSGDVVTTGTPIAFVGSSGCSYNPHLHFQVEDPSGGRIDPFAGSCNGDNGTDTWWLDEKPYWEPRINRLMTHSAEPSLHGYDGSNEWCPIGEDINKKNQFNQGETVWFGTAIYSPQPDDEIDFRIYEPDGDLLWTHTYTYSGNEPTVKEYYVFGNILSSNAPSGTYRFRAFYHNVVYNHWFTVGCTSSYTLSGGLPFHHGYIASSSITNSGQTTGGGRTAYYQSAGHIQLNPGFHAGGGVSLKARIKSCGHIE